MGPSVCDISPGIFPLLTSLEDQQVYLQKKPSCTWGHLEPAPSAGAQLFFTHTTSNNTTVMNYMNK